MLDTFTDQPTGIDYHALNFAYGVLTDPGVVWRAAAPLAQHTPLVTCQLKSG